MTSASLKMLLGGSIPTVSLAPDESAEQALVSAGSRLATEITESFNADFNDVWRVLTHLPDGFLSLLESPEGWTALSALVANDLNLAGGVVMPVLH